MGVGRQSTDQQVSSDCKNLSLKRLENKAGIQTWQLVPVVTFKCQKADLVTSVCVCMSLNNHTTKPTQSFTGSLLGTYAVKALVLSAGEPRIPN